MLELQEVELLNKVLEKALKVRGNNRSDPPSNKVPPTICSTHAKASSCPSTKEKPPTPASRTSASSTKPGVYLLNPPYRTNHEKKRNHGPGKAAVNKLFNKASSGQLATKKDTYDRERQTETMEDSSKKESTIVKAASHSTSAMEAAEEKDHQYFTLKDKGSTLKLPVEYRREYTRNSRLWEKFYEAQSNLPSTCPPFIQKLQTTFTPSCPGMSLSELEDNIAQLEQAVSVIQQSVEGFKSNHSAVRRHWENYRSLLFSEVLQEQTLQHLSSLHRLQEGAEQYLKWSEQQSSSLTSIEPTRCRTSTRTARPILLYSNPLELSQLASCRLRVLELQQKIYLHKVLRDELLAEAESQCHEAPASRALFRAIYTELCEGGDRFPVLVHEEN
ncbi:tubulin epsilon and delta complex protein 2 isoform X2 [Bombina bombina]|nr:tubulin epsilon and delta complex protein 2 isoform X2 [Bombina bombina]XP_053550943.1 tubulin epsilon and delta complex protein 2 isoform X2 [Bombina bombina]